MGRAMGRVVREVFEALILTAILYLMIHAVVETKRVEGRSMEPTLQSGYHLIVNKAVYWRIDPGEIERLVSRKEREEKSASGAFYIFGAPQRGDVIVLRYPKDTSRDFIKRVIAVPGDTVEIKQGRVYVNGQALDEPYVRDRPNYYMQKQVVPPDNYFVLGDNRSNSLDSHVWGMLPADDIVGKAWILYWPLGKLGWVPNATLSAQEAR